MSMGDWATERNVMCVVCPSCAFTFDILHTDPGGTYSCPCCGHGGDPEYTVAQIRERVRAAQEAIVREDYAGASTFAVERMSLAIERVLARAFPEDGGASDG